MYEHLTDRELIATGRRFDSQLIAALTERLEMRLDDPMVEDVRKLLAASGEVLTLDDVPNLPFLGTPREVAGYILGVIAYGLSHGYDLDRAWSSLMAEAVRGVVTDQMELEFTK